MILCKYQTASKGFQPLEYQTQGVETPWKTDTTEDYTET